MLSLQVRHLVPVYCLQCKTLTENKSMQQRAASLEPAGRDVALRVPCATQAARMGPRTPSIQRYIAPCKPSDAATPRVRGWI
jgi:hypothetical protein